VNKILFASMAFAGLLVACGRDTNQPAPAAPAQPAAPPVATPTPPPAMPVAAEPVDVCAMVSREDAEAVLGKLMKEPETQAAQGSMLGGCNYMSESGTFMMVSARPAGEFDGTVKYTEKKGPYTEVPGLGEKAYDTTAGVMVQPAGKPYFVVVFAAGGSGAQGSKALELAKKLKL
jgi:hypothetical protein